VVELVEAEDAGCPWARDTQKRVEEESANYHPRKKGNGQQGYVRNVIHHSKLLLRGSPVRETLFPEQFVWGFETNREMT
jgi:hypothetical protein